MLLKLGYDMLLSNFAFSFNLRLYHLGVKAIRNYIPMPKTGDVPYTHADITRARKELNYEPQTSLDEGLKIFVDWYKVGSSEPHSVPVLAKSLPTL